MLNKRKAKAVVHQFIKVDPTTSRWKWIGPKTNTGYGRVNVPGIGSILAHRLIHLIYIGPVDPEWEVDHKNGDRNDVTPSNLEAVPKHINIQRAAKKGVYRGERNGNSKLDPETVSFIKLLYFEIEYTQAQISRETSINPVTISDICRGRTWKHITVDWMPKPGEIPEYSRRNTETV